MHVLLWWGWQSTVLGNPEARLPRTTMPLGCSPAGRVIQKLNGVSEKKKTDSIRITQCNSRGQICYCFRYYISIFLFWFSFTFFNYSNLPPIFFLFFVSSFSWSCNSSSCYSSDNRQDKRMNRAVLLVVITASVAVVV